jgi:hypothetical protein
MRSSTSFRSIAWLIIAALVVQPWIGQQAVAKASEAFDTLVICTGTGFKVISVPADVLPLDHPADIPDQSPGHHDAAAANCPACLVQALGVLGSAGRIDPPSLHRYWIGEAHIVDLWVAKPLCHRPLGSRGPPSA